MEKIIETKKCKHCDISFDITDNDLSFYDKVSPVFNWEKFLIPTPKFCPECRQKSRLAWRNERYLYRRKCDSSWKDIITVYSPDKKDVVYENSVWFWDSWDPLDYWVEFDLNKSFLKQFNDLLYRVPKLALLTVNNFESQFVNYSADVNRCYMIYASSRNEDSFYSRWTMNSKRVIDSTNISSSEKLFECIDCKNLNNWMYCIWCIDSSNCFCSYDLIWCDNCIWCSTLRNKSYCIFNVQYTEEEYETKKIELIINKDLLLKVIKKWFHRYAYSFNVEESSWEYMINTKNVKIWYDVENLENCKYITNALELSNSMDIDFQAFPTSFCYNNLWIEDANNSHFNFWVIKWSNIMYSFFSLWCNNLFWCVWLSNKEYCILNKQYTKQEYEDLVPKIIEKMREDGEWWEFFPASMSPFGYNETVANEYIPLKKDEAIKAWFNWSDYEAPKPNVEKIIPASKLPENIEDIPDDILNRAIECEVTKKPFRIIKQELEFYRKHNLPIPRRHPDQRHLDRMALRNPRKLYDRKCDKCSKDIKTTYSPDRSEIVYCESCYNKEVY